MEFICCKYCGLLNAHLSVNCPTIQCKICKLMDICPLDVLNQKFVSIVTRLTILLLPANLILLFEQGLWDLRFALFVAKKDTFLPVVRIMVQKFALQTIDGDGEKPSIEDIKRIAFKIENMESIQGKMALKNIKKKTICNKNKCYSFSLL